MSNRINVQSKDSTIAGFLAFDEQLGMLQDELKNRFSFPPANFPQSAFHLMFHGGLIFFEGARPFDACPWWAALSFSGASIIHFDSIADAAKALRGLGSIWQPYTREETGVFRRTMLIQEKLPYISQKPRAFPLRFSVAPPNLGFYTLLDEHTLFAAPKTSSALPLGKIVFAEDHTEPPSRAYLKLWEALTVMQFAGFALPQKYEKCFDAGGSPGGWTWALLKLGCTVISCDRAELSPSLIENADFAPRLTFIKHDAFTLPFAETIGFCDWVFSDVICYPERLLAWIKMLISDKICKHMVCSIKMQGKTDWGVLREFEKIEGSFIRHLSYNKHELCFFWSA